MTTDPQTRERTEQEDAIYSETDPIIWLRVERYKTARNALSAAWNGNLPWVFSEDGWVLRKHLKVTRVWMLNEGEKNGYDECWREVIAVDAWRGDLTEFFRVEPARGGSTP